MKCKGCGEELDEYCLDCQAKEISKAFAEANRERQKGAKRYRLVPIEKDSSQMSKEGLNGQVSY